MTTHELLGEDCMSFADWYAQYPPRAYTFPRVDRVHSFLTQPLTPEWVEKYVEGFKWKGMDVFTNGKITYFKSFCS